MIRYGQQFIGDQEREAVERVLRSDFLTQGPSVEAFEQALCRAVGARHAVAVSSGTAALHLAYKALGIGPGDRVWTSPNTFLATANAALLCGASVDLVDIELDGYNLSVEALACRLADARASGTLPSLVVPVHFAGQACELEAIRELSRQYGFRVVEDACHALGAGYQRSVIGDCAFSEAAVFSFHPVKSITTGEGGAIVTNDPGIAENARRLRSHGVTRDPAEMQAPDEGNWYYEQLELGLNYRLTDIQAALGVVQLGRLEAMIQARREVARRYDIALADLPVILPGGGKREASSWHLYVIRVASAEVRKALYDFLQREGVGVNVHYIPLDRQPFFQRLGVTPCAQARQYYEGCLSLPIHPSLGQDQARVVALLRAFFDKVSV